MFFSLNQLALRNSTAPTRPADRSRLGGVLDRVAVLRAGEEPARVLEQDRAQLAGLGQGLEGVREARPDLVPDLVGQVLGVDPRLRGQLGGKRLAQVLGQPLDLGRLTGHQRVRLDVEGEVRWRPLDPQLGRPPGRQGVVGGVDLDDREPAGVVGQPLLGRVRRIGVEHAPGGHRRVGPRRGPDPDVAARGRRDRVGRDIFGQGLGTTSRAVGAWIVGAVEVRRGRRRERGGAPAGWGHAAQASAVPADGHPPPSRAGRRRSMAVGQAGAGNVDLEAMRSTTDMLVVYAASPTVPDVSIQTPRPPTLMR